MKNEPARKQIIDENRAESLLGLTRSQLRELSEASGLGSKQPGNTSEDRRFSYEELYKLCRMVAGPTV